MQWNHNGPSVYGVMAFAESANAGPRFVWAVNLNQQRQIEGLLWLAHCELAGAFGGWLAGLESPPATAVLLGGGVRLNQKTATGAAQLLRELHGLAEPHSGPRPVCQIAPDGRVRTFTSVAAASEANGVSRPRIARCLGTLAIRGSGLWI
jgi:hypothetical protein